MEDLARAYCKRRDDIADLWTQLCCFIHESDEKIDLGDVPALALGMRAHVRAVQVMQVQGVLLKCPWLLPGFIPGAFAVSRQGSWWIICPELQRAYQAHRQEAHLTTLERGGEYFLEGRSLWSPVTGEVAFGCLGEKRVTSPGLNGIVWYSRERVWFRPFEPDGALVSIVALEKASFCHVHAVACSDTEVFVVVVNRLEKMHYIVVFDAGAGSDSDSDTDTQAWSATQDIETSDFPQLRKNFHELVHDMRFVGGHGQRHLVLSTTGHLLFLNLDNPGEVRPSVDVDLSSLVFQQGRMFHVDVQDLGWVSEFNLTTHSFSDRKPLVLVPKILDV